MKKMTRVFGRKDSKENTQDDVLDEFDLAVQRVIGKVKSYETQRVEGPAADYARHAQAIYSACDLLERGFTEAQRIGRQIEGELIGWHIGSGQSLITDTASDYMNYEDYRNRDKQTKDTFFNPDQFTYRRNRSTFWQIPLIHTGTSSRYHEQDWCRPHVGKMVHLQYGPIKDHEELLPGRKEWDRSSAAGPVVPQEIHRIAKRGFTPPEGMCEGPVQDYVRNVLLPLENLMLSHNLVGTVSILGEDGKYRTAKHEKPILVKEDGEITLNMQEKEIGAWFTTLFALANQAAFADELPGKLETITRRLSS